MKKNIQEIKAKVRNLKGWIFKESKIEKTFEFKNFLESIEFVNKVSKIAEELNHHPDIEINYNKVTVSLSTHEEGGVTDKDITLAKTIDVLK